MTIRRGTGVIKRRHGRNFIDPQANKRFDECVRPYQEQGLHALGVDYFEVLLYQRAMSTQVCTCKQTEVAPPQLGINLSLPPNVINPKSDTDAEITIDYARPLFGTRGEATNNLDYTSSLEFAEDDDIIDEDALDDDEIPTRTSENLFSANADCGICYRTGYVPGYSLYGWDRKVLCTYNMTNIYGYHVNQSKAPHVFDKVDDEEGYVEFIMQVPRHFRRLKYCIRNNHLGLVDDELFNAAGQPLTLNDVRAAAGKEMLVRVTAEAFTHIVFEFDLGVQPVHANISQMSRSIDWTMFDTLGTMTITLPMTIKEVQSSDFIYVPSRYQVLKVTDTPFLRTAGDKTLDWSVTCRITQPQEPVKLIYQGRWLL